MEPTTEISCLFAFHPRLDVQVFLSDLENYINNTIEFPQAVNRDSLETSIRVAKQVLISISKKDSTGKGEINEPCSHELGLTVKHASSTSSTIMDGSAECKLFQICERLLCTTLCETSPSVMKLCYEFIGLVFLKLSIEKQKEVMVQCIRKLDILLQCPESTCISTFTTLLHSLHDIIVEHECVFEDICNQLLDILYKALTVENDQITVTALSYILSLVLKNKLQTVKDIPKIGFELWNVIKQIHTSHCQKYFKDYLENTYLTERPFTILCASSNFLFSQSASLVLSSVLCDETLWTIIQHGFFHVNPLTRKRSLFLLKRIIDIMQQDTEEPFSTLLCNDGVPIFWWSKDHQNEMVNMWDEIFLLLETLEEKQVHVIKPVMPKLSSLIGMTCERTGSKPILHTSWILALLQRIACHESSYVKRWGVSELLKLDLTHCPVYTQGGHTFLTEPFLAMLTESTIYYKPVELNLGECPPIVEDLGKFFTATFKAVPVEKRGELLQDILKGITKFSWSGAALFYVTRGMTFIEEDKILTNSGLLSIKDIIASITSNVASYFRGAIQQNLCSILTQLIDCSRVSITELTGFLAVLPSNECVKRGTVTWRQLSQWLYNTVKNERGQKVEQWQETNVVDSIETATQACLSSDTFLVEGVVRLLLITVDSGLVPLRFDRSIPDRKSLESILNPVLDMLTTVGRRLYMSAEKADAAFLLFNCLCREAQLYNGGQDEMFVFLKSIVAPDLICSVLQYVTRRVCDVKMVGDLEKMSVLGETIQHMSSLNSNDFQSDASLCNLVQQCQSLIKESCQESECGQTLRCSGMMVLSSLCKTESLTSTLSPLLTRSFSSRVISSSFKKPKELQPQQGEQKDLVHMDWGRVSSVFLEAQWQCILATLPSQPPQHTAAYAPLVSLALDLLGDVSLIPVFKCAVLIMPKVTEDTMLEWLTLAWKRTQEQNNSSSFWLMYKYFMEILVKTASQTSTSGTSPLRDAQQQICDEIFTSGEEKTGLVNQLVSSLYNWWEQSPSGMESAMLYTDFIVKAALFGEIHAKGKRFISEVSQYLQKCGDQLSVNQLLDNTRKDDAMVRVCTLTFLSKLKPDEPLHRQLGLEILHALFTNHKELMAQSGYRNFSNSLAHRKKHRIFCAIMVLHQFLGEIVDEVFDFLVRGLSFENQPSVRHQIEWLLTRLLHNHKHFMPKFWSHFNVANEKKPALMCSFLTVLTILIKLQDDAQKQSFLLETIPRVFPFATVQQFNIRLFAQGFLLLAWKMSLQEGLTEVLTTHALLQSFLDFCQQNKQAKAATQKLLKLFVYSVHPFDDFTIENVTNTLPYLCELSDEEWVSAEKFDSIAHTWNIEGQHSMPLRGTSDNLKHCMPGTWKVKYSGYDEDWVEHSSDVQKKVIPWRLMLPEQELEAGLQEEYVKKRQNTGGMVLVTSLIDKVPNLGGLCRTSEIFGVSEYVLGSFQYLKDKSFESLSVTSHKWLPMKEVKPHYLRTYLLEMREAGYTLVGAEQTANSVCLTDYTFPKKTVLVLGNEKEGIPVDIIQLLDVCVEIPQQGVVRSLNVHVSGALLVWEYTRQHLLK